MGTRPRHVENGGAYRDRTDDLLHAMQALSQLSYGPTREGREFWGTPCAKSNELPTLRPGPPRGARDARGRWYGGARTARLQDAEKASNFLTLNNVLRSYLHEFIDLASIGLLLARC